MPGGLLLREEDLAIGALADLLEELVGIGDRLVLDLDHV